MSLPGVYEFYVDRIIASRNYGLFQGDKILNMILRCVYRDDCLTLDECNNIIMRCQKMHEQLMEDNYNERWNH